MKESIHRRALSLLLALALVFGLAPAALAEDATISLIAGGRPVTGADLGNINPADSIQMVADLSTGEDTSVRFSWTSDNTSVATVDYDTSGQGREARITGHSPGEARVTVSGNKNGIQSVTLKVTVNGIAVLNPSISILENEAMTLREGTDFVRYGAAAEATAQPSLTSRNQTFVRTTGTNWNSLTVDGIAAGASQVVLEATDGGATIGGAGTFSVNVGSNQSVINYTSGVSATAPLKFSNLESQIASECTKMIEGSTLVSITGLSVPADQGTLYLGYQSADNTGSGVGGSLTYYASGQPRGPYIKDIVFVPNSRYTGATATISYSGVADSGRTFRGRIVVTLKEATAELTVSTPRNTPLKLSGSMFSRICEQMTGTPLSYVTFTQPPSTQGTLYQGYISASNFTSVVDPNTRYSQTALNDVTFVPAANYVGPVHIAYVGYSSSGVRYDSELVINVAQGADDGLEYNDNGNGYVTLNQRDLAAFYANATGGTLRYVRFTLPSASQGTLFQDWRGGNTGSFVQPGTDYNVDVLGRITFVAVNGFEGTVRIPFTAYDAAGTQCSGTITLQFQTLDSSGDINYTCTPGGSVKLTTADFNTLCMTITGQRLHYITFQSLPAATSGTLYHNRTSADGIGTRVGTSTKYFNSNTPYITNLSFWATDTFRGSVEIPFVGCSINGATFNGLLVITSSSTSGGGSGSTGLGTGTASSGTTLVYATSGRNPVALNGDDFDKASRAATNSALNYVNFTLPSSEAGGLFYNYALSDTPPSVTTSDNVYRTGEISVSKISFVPAFGYNGVVQIPYTGYAISGAQFQGTLQITVGGGTSGGAARYTTTGTPVTFSAADFQGAVTGAQPKSIRLDGVPPLAAGRIYYGYVTPTQYSWLGNATTDYGITTEPLASNLTFVPKAGFQGRVTIPYTATSQDGGQYSGEIVILVESPLYSEYFDDLSGCTSEMLAAADYLSSQGVVNGISPRQYGPNLSIRRGDFCLMLYRAFQFSSGGSVSAFNDVPDSAYYAEAVDVLRSQGIVEGTGGNLFQPSATLSRQDAALMIQRTLRAAGMSAENGAASLLESYSDAWAVDSYAVGGLACLVQLGLLPTANNQLAPRDALSRADMAVLLHRAMTQ